MTANRSLEHVLRRRFAALFERLPGALEGGIEDVHQARVASRRVRETLPVAHAALLHVAVRRLQQDVRRTTRALGPVRELDVTLGLLRDVEERSPPLQAAIDEVRQAVAAERERRRERMLHRLAGRQPRLEERAETFLLAVGRADEALAARALADRAAGRARQLREAVEEAGALYASDRLHAVRITAKKLRYGLELSHELGLAGTKAMVRRLKGAQDLLGRLHDLEVLLFSVQQAQVARVAGTRGRRDPLVPLAVMLQRECRKLHAGYVRRRDELGRLADAVLDRTASRIETGPTRVRGRSATG